MAVDDDTEVVIDVTGEGTTSAVFDVLVVLSVFITIVLIVLSVVSIFIDRRRRRYHPKTNRYSTTVHDTHTLHLSYSKYCPQTGLHTALCKYLYSVV